MAINKVVAHGQTLIDLTEDTVTAETLKEGVIAHAKNGEVIIGTMTGTGTNLPELTNEGTAADLLAGKELIDSDGNIVTGIISTKSSANLIANGAMVTVPSGYYANTANKSVATTSQAVPSITVDSNGLITASATQNEGYVINGTKTSTKQLTTQAAKTITPTKSNQVAVASGVYATGAVTVAPIPNEYIITTDATATADKIFKDESAYVNGQKIFGSFTIDNEVNEQADLISQIQSALEGKAAGGGVTLPTLTNPASASDILSGKEAINGDGTKITGTIATKTSSNLTASGATVTVPAGYYASQSTKSVATATQATPTVSIDANGKITASATQTAGYVSAGTKSGTKQLTIQAAKTITPSTSSQTAVAKNVYTTGAITVGAIPSNYEDVGTETNAYTAKLATLETAITALETELEGKASGGSGGASVETCTVIFEDNMAEDYSNYGSNYIHYITVDANGNRVYNTYNLLESNGSFQFENVACDSLIIIFISIAVDLFVAGGEMLAGYTDHGQGAILKTPSERDTEMSITINSD